MGSFVNMKIDLSYPIHEGMFKYPSDPEVGIERKEAVAEEIEEIIYDASGFTSGAATSWIKYKSGNLYLKMRSHHATHIDAPTHKLAGGKNIDEYEIEKFENTCALVELTSMDLMSRKERMITKDDIAGVCDFRQYNGVRALIFYTGFCDEMVEMREKEGSLRGKEKEDFEKRFPYFNVEAARFIIEKNRYLNIVGIDSFSVDCSGSNSEVHRVFFARDILPLETLVNLGELKKVVGNNLFRLVSVPIKYERGDAAQVRAYAVVGG